MADISIVTSVAITLRGMRGLVFTTNLIGYLFYTDGSNDFVYKKTTDGGITWAAPVAISGNDTIVAYDVWYDQWTPGDTGRCVHIWYFGVTTDNIKYRRLCTVDDFLLAAVDVLVTTSAVAGRGTFVSGAKMRGGNLLACWDIDAGAEHGTYRSVDNGVTWGARTDLVEATLDQGWVYPGNEADPNDAWIIYYDASATALTLKMHDDSANTNSESATIQTQTSGITDLSGQYPNAGAIRHSDGHLILASWSLRDNASGVFNAYDINGTGSIVSLTALATNIDDCYYPSVFIDQRNDWIYIAYVGKSDGSETLDTTASVYHAISKDRGVTWSKDNLISASGSDWRGCWTPLSGPRFTAVWQDISSLALMTNNDNSHEVLGPIMNNYQHVRARDGISVAEKIR
jgi:hypothetical protein